MSPGAQATRSNNHLNSQILENLAVGFLHIDQNQTLIDVNGAFCRLSGYSKEELIGTKRPFPYWPEEDVEKLQALIAQFPMADAGQSWELRIKHKNGHLIPVLVSPSLLRDEAGKPYSFFSTIVDIRKRKEAQHELELANERLRNAIAHAELMAVQANAANHSKSAFLATISHEIRTPMNGIIGMLSLLKTTPLNPTQLRYLESVEASASGLLTLLSDVLDFARLESGKLQLKPVTFHPRQLFADVAMIMRVRAEQKSLQFDMEVSDSVPPAVVADADRLRQVVLNLVSNAIKFTPKGYVRVNVGWRTDATPSQQTLLTVDVADSGVGIRRDHLSKLFEKFSQLDNSFSRQYEGVGLGLAICRELVQLMQGEIHVESELGVGSRFCLAVPVGIEPQEKEPDVADDVVCGPQAAPNGNATQSSCLAEGLRILVVEDNLINREVTEGFLERLGAEITLAENGHQAMRHLLSKDFDLILMDVQMPDLDGIEVTRMIRAGEAGETARATPVIAITAHAMHGDRDRFLRAGMDGYLSKPILFKELSQMVQRFSSRRALREGS